MLKIVSIVKRCSLFVKKGLCTKNILTFTIIFFSVMKLEDLKDVYDNWLALLWEPLRQCYTWVEETVFLLLCCSLSYWQVWTNSVRTEKERKKYPLFKDIHEVQENSIYKDMKTRYIYIIGSVKMTSTSEIVTAVYK